MVDVSVPDSGLPAGAQPDTSAMQRFPVDIEHLGIRMAVPVAAMGSLILGWILIPQLIAWLDLESSPVSFLQLPLIILSGIGGAYLADRLLKGRWESGRALYADDAHLMLQEKDGTRLIALDERVNVLAWRFTISRRGRVPKGHYCLALQFIQDDTRITLYTFIAPDKAADLANFDQFTPLAARKSLQDERLSMRMAGQQRRLLQAEDERWQHGAELLAEDFAALWGLLQDVPLAFQQ